MINSSKRPTGLRKALTIPILLAVVVLACSKEQSAPVQAQTKLLTLDNVKSAKILRDSVKFINLVYVTERSSKKELAHIVLDTLGSKVKLDFQQAEDIRIEGKMTNDNPSQRQLPPPVKD